MGKCLITKLNGTIDNSSILRLGEFRISVHAMRESVVNSSRAVGLSVASPVNLEIIGDGYFTDRNLTENKGKTLAFNNDTDIFVSNTDCNLAILDKYKITALTGYNSVVQGGVNNTTKGFNIENLRYSKNLKIINFVNSKVTGDISSLKDLPLREVALAGSDVYGDAGTLGNVRSITSLFLINTNTNCKLEDLRSLNNLKSITLGNAQGDISSLSGLNIKDIWISNGDNLFGDIAKLPSNFVFLGLNIDNNATFTWSDRPTSYKIFANVGYPKITNLDEALIGMSRCTSGITSSSDANSKNISYRGTRTSASDDAIATLQQKGYTVSIKEI